ncbi:hypothetical protein LEP1GSC188_3528 [Leptospira weilii serovar Topaz str. LT2116]|uniref:Uncharacterized protein n=1 Tax=Leptospira weilii serovar Topaz str. LT2116 TaxID=1088540 RepID=M3GW21_9LEPT|nr:hypothetical protein LEP1GSC188_3528 [Leptospira weilii serovar Topaz str. LT2116]
MRKYWKSKRKEKNLRITKQYLETIGIEGPWIFYKRVNRLIEISKFTDWR